MRENKVFCTSFWIFAILFLLFLPFINSWLSLKIENLANDTNESKVVKTTAHTSVEGTEWQEIYRNEDEDVAYYRHTGDKQLVKPGDTIINVNGDEVEVKSTDINGFLVDYDDSFYPGMSGTPVTDSNGNPVGYVSSVVESKFVYCIWN